MPPEVGALAYFAARRATGRRARRSRARVVGGGQAGVRNAVGQPVPAGLRQQATSTQSRWRAVRDCAPVGPPPSCSEALLVRKVLVLDPDVCQSGGQSRFPGPFFRASRLSWSYPRLSIGPSPLWPGERASPSHRRGVQLAGTVLLRLPRGAERRTSGSHRPALWPRSRDSKRGSDHPSSEQVRGEVGGGLEMLPGNSNPVTGTRATRSARAKTCRVPGDITGPASATRQENWTEEK